MLARILVGIHAVVFLCLVFTAPAVTVADLECQPEQAEGPGELCLATLGSYHRVLLASRDIGGVWLRQLLFFADLPAVLGVAAIDFALGIPETAAVQIRRSWVLAALWLGLGTLQWWAVGTFLDRRRRPRLQKPVM